MQLWICYQITASFQSVIIAKRVFNNFQISSAIQTSMVIVAQTSINFQNLQLDVQLLRVR
jgi:hypothetical protein